MKIANRCSGKPASLASSTMARWTSQCTPRQSGTNRQWDELSSPGTSQSWRAQQGSRRGGEVNNQHQWRSSQLPISQRSWGAQQGPSGGEALGGQHPGRRSPGGGGGEEDDSLNIDTSFSYFQLSLSWLMYFSVMTLIVYDIVFELLPRSLGLDSASTNKSFNLYYFRFLAVKRQIQHQNKKWSLYDLMVMRTYDYMMKIIWLWWLLLIACCMNTKQPLK